MFLPLDGAESKSTKLYLNIVLRPFTERMKITRYEVNVRCFDNQWNNNLTCSIDSDLQEKICKLAEDICCTTVMLSFVWRTDITFLYL